MIARCACMLGLFLLASVSSAQAMPRLFSVMMAGYGPEQLAATGCDAKGVQVLDAALVAHAGVLERFVVSSERHRALCNELDKVEKAILSLGHTEELDERANVLRGDVRSALDALNTARSELDEVLETALGTQQTDDDRRMMRLFLSNARREAPPRFKVLRMDEASWSMLMSLLEKSASGAPLTLKEESLLKGAESHPDVVLARQRLDSILPSIERSWGLAVMRQLEE